MFISSATDPAQAASPTFAPVSMSTVSTAAPAYSPLRVEDIEGDLELRSGRVAPVRAIHVDDAERLQAFHRRLSPESVAFRFFRYLPELPMVEARRLTTLDYEDRMALVTLAPTAPNGERDFIGVVRYERIAPNLAEIAFVVADAWQGQGIATALLHRLAAYARGRGIDHFLAITMRSNTRMLAVLRHSGYPVTYEFEEDEAQVTLDIRHPVEGEPAFAADPHAAAQLTTG